MNLYNREQSDILKVSIKETIIFNSSFHIFF